MLKSAKPGDTVRLVAGKYPPITLKEKNWVPPMIIDASAATVPSVAVIASNGITWIGGTMNGTLDANGLGSGYGFTANRTSKNISVSKVHLSGYRLGIGFDRVTGGKISGNWLSKMSADGIDVSLSRNIVIDNNACTDFVTKEGNHPDCIQLWSRPDVAPTSDVVISNNSAIGAMQGISLFNHTRDGVDDGGFDRITISGNKVLNTMGQGIAVYDCRSCVVKNNTVGSLPNYINVAQLNIQRSSVVQCGNVVTMIPRQSTPACPK